MKKKILILVATIVTSIVYGQDKSVSLEGHWTNLKFGEKSILQESEREKIYINISVGGFFMIDREAYASKNDTTEFLVYTFDQASNTITLNNGIKAESFRLHVPNDSTFELLSLDSSAHFISSFKKISGELVPDKFGQSTVSHFGGIASLQGLWSLKGSIKRLYSGNVYSISTNPYYWSFNSNHPETDAGSIVCFQQELTSIPNESSIQDVFGFFYLGDKGYNGYTKYK